MLTAAELKLIFEKPYNRATWYNVLVQNFNVNTLRKEPLDITKRLTDNQFNATAFELGNFNTIDGHLVGLYELEVSENVNIFRNRKGLRDLLKQVYKNDVEAALLVFIQGTKWRFTYVSEITVKNKTTGKREQKTTEPKRYTYLLGEGERCKTAADQFAKVTKTDDLFGGGISLTALEDAFNVDKMSKLFFNEYRKQYGYFTALLTGEDENGKKVKEASPFLASVFDGKDIVARDFVKKMMGRIVFLYFLEKKGWLGVAENKKWGDGDENFLSNLFNLCRNKEIFYSNVLVPLFFATLNTDRKDDFFKIDPNLFTTTGYNKLKIPYLNGGLFEEDDASTQLLVFPEALFENLFTFFDQYNFTVYEDSPDEHTVAVDPEMLGHIFENLLEDNKDKGAFYTPKEIVHYMCRESLIEYLYTKLNPQNPESFKEIGKQQTDMYGNAARKQLTLQESVSIPTEKIARKDIENFVLEHEARNIIEHEEAILTALKDVKICDPAIGSGAFPMGLLMEIYYLVDTIFAVSPDVTNKIWELGNSEVLNGVKVKEQIIQNSIFGVDIEKGAVDIARLRFWLSLVVDEETPKPLPNLDYKIVVGNSLLSKFQDKQIDIEWNYTLSHGTAETKGLIAELVSKLYVLQSKQALYFGAKSGKSNLQKEIRILKIEILIIQIKLSSISFKEKNPILGGFSPLPKEIEKNLYTKLAIADFEQIIQTLSNLKKDPTSEINYFDWKLDFPEVMNDKIIDKNKVGFDIVIGNPPYIQMQKDKGYLANELCNSDFLTYERTGDVYSIFYEKGFQLLKDLGIHTFITSSQWMKANYGKSLRNYFLKQNPKTLVLLGPGIFENATVDTNIMVAQKGIFKRELRGFVAQNKNEIENINKSPFVKMNYLGEEAWSIIGDNKQQLNEKFKKFGKELRKWNIKINFGIKTGINEAFIVNESKRKQLIKLDKHSKEIIKPILRGREINKYFTQWDGGYIIATFPTLKLEISDYLGVEEYLKSFVPRINQTGETYIDSLGALKKTRKKSSNKWFETQDPIGYHQEFQKEKIIWKRIGSDLRFSYFKNEIYSLDSTCVATGEKIKYLLALLNSKLCKYQLFEYAPRTGMGDLLISVQALEPLLVHYPNEIEEKKIIEIVEQILSKKENDLTIDIMDLENKIDLIVYKLYKLSYKEACIIEGNTEWMTEEVYDNYTLED